MENNIQKEPFTFKFDASVGILNTIVITITPEDLRRVADELETQIELCKIKNNDKIEDEPMFDSAFVEKVVNDNKLLLFKSFIKKEDKNNI